MLTSILSLLGGGIGGLLRFVPEIIKFFGDRNDRDHEFRMATLQLQIDQARAAQAIDLVHAQGEAAEMAGQMQAYAEALKGQSQITGVPWVDALNSTVRPFITYWWMILFAVYKLCTIVTLATKTSTLADFAAGIWTDNDWGILSMILGFWFVDRAIRKQQGK